MLTQEKSTSHEESRKTAESNGDVKGASFAELLEQYEPETLQRGQFVQGQVVQIDHNVILADVDAKRTAVVPPQDLALVEEQILDQLSVGDEITLYVLRTPRGDEDLLVSLNKGLEIQDWRRAKEHLAAEEPLELQVTGYNKGGLTVAFGSLQGFVPASHVPQLRNSHDRNELLSRKAELVGEDLMLQVIEVDRGSRRLILSAKRARKETRRQRLLELKLQEGKTITGHVTNLVSFGAFVELDGIEGLVHVSEMSWQNVSNPANHLTPGEEVTVLIQSVDIDRQRISLSLRALLPNPWEAFAQSHSTGQLVGGVVSGVADFGAFIRVAEGIEGLVHSSEMHGTQDFAPEDLLYPGDEILVRVMDIQPERMRLSLSQRRVSQQEEMEWMQRKAQSALPAAEEEE
jgi:small subunit ribosomal protein S1